MLSVIGGSFECWGLHCWVLGCCSWQPFHTSNLLMKDCGIWKIGMYLFWEGRRHLWLHCVLFILLKAVNSFLGMRERAESLSNGDKECLCPAKNTVVLRIPVDPQERFKSWQWLLSCFVLEIITLPVYWDNTVSTGKLENLHQSDMNLFQCSSFFLSLNLCARWRATPLNTLSLASWTFTRPTSKQHSTHNSP